MFTIEKLKIINDRGVIGDEQKVNGKHSASYVFVWLSKLGLKQEAQRVGF